MVGHGARAMLVQRPPRRRRSPPSRSGSTISRRIHRHLCRPDRRHQPALSRRGGGARPLRRRRLAAGGLHQQARAAFAVAARGSSALADRFAAIAGQDTFAVRKPDPRHLIETIRAAGGDPRPRGDGRRLRGRHPNRAGGGDSGRRGRFRLQPAAGRRPRRRLWSSTISTSCTTRRPALLRPPPATAPCVTRSIKHSDCAATIAARSRRIGWKRGPRLSARRSSTQGGRHAHGKSLLAAIAAATLAALATRAPAAGRGQGQHRRDRRRPDRRRGHRGGGRQQREAPQGHLRQAGAAATARPDWANAFSPKGVTCYPAQQACYNKNGAYNANWTWKIYAK